MINSSKTGHAKSTQFRNLILFSAAIFIVVIIFVWMLANQSKSSKLMTENTHFSNPLDHSDSGTIVLERVQKSVEEAKRQIEGLKKQVDEKIGSERLGEDGKQNELESRLKALETQLSAKQNSPDNSSNVPLSLTGSQHYQGRVLPRGFDGSQNEYTEEIGMREDRLTLTPTEEELAKRRPLKNPETYVPAGTFVTGIIIEGADPSTSVMAQSNPEPMLIRLTSQGTLPNHQKSHLKGCHVTVAAYGDISSERGKIRTERMSCVAPNGEIIDLSVEANVAGPDGKNGVRGNLREGGVVYTAGAFGSGFLDGFSKGVADQFTVNSVSAQGTVQTTKSGKTIQYGLANGSSSALDRLADHMMKRAEQFQPTIQLSAGTEVEVVFQKGFYLDGKTHDGDDKNEKEPAPLSNMFDTKNNTTRTRAAFPSPDDSTLPLTANEVKRLHEQSKELGLKISKSMGDKP